MSETISGTIERIIFFNPSSGYTVLNLKDEKLKRSIVVVGHFPELNVGESISIDGRWVKFEKWGEQFKAENYQILTPSSISGLIKFLSSGLIKGIGPELARRIVDRFGDKTLEIISREPEKIAEVVGIGGKKIYSIVESWKEHKEKSHVLIKLRELGLTLKMAMKIYKEYGNNSLKVIKEDPYQLAEDIFGIGFRIADRIALSSGIDPRSPIRVRSYILYLMGRDVEDGHVFSFLDSIAQKVLKELEMEDLEKVYFLIEELSRKGKVVKVNNEEREILYLPFLFRTEFEIAKGIVENLNFPKTQFVLDTKQYIEESEREMGIKLAPKQIEAIESSLREKVMILTGGPGTGKTTIIRAIINIYNRLGKRVLLCAPTGRAAKRLSETSGEDAKTIHRLLEYKPGENVFLKNERNPLKADLIIVDEFSMVDIPLMFNFMKAIPPWTSLLFVGDKDQLPSVGPGNILKDLIQSSVIRVVELEDIFRQSRESMIVVNSHRIRKGEFPYLFKERDDFIFISEEDEEKAFKRITDLVTEEIPERFGFDPMSSQIQVISPLYKGIAGVENLNRALQERLNPKGEGFLGAPFRIGDKVMQIKNNYDKDVYNGDIGRVTHLDEKGITVLFDKEVKYEREELDELTLAYAISVHKSQGSEYEACVMPILTQQYIMLQRNLLYTALTRAKKLAVLVGSKKALAIAIRNNKPYSRNTRLSSLLVSLKNVKA